MMCIGPSRRRAIPLLGLLVPLVLLGCGTGYDVVRREAAAPQEVPPDETCRFESCRLILPVSRALWLESLDSVGRQHWPDSLYADFRVHQERRRALGARTPKWPTRSADRYRLEPFRGHGWSCVARPGGHTLYFVSVLTMRNVMRSAGTGSGSFHTLAVLDVDGGMREQVLLRNVEGGHSDAALDFEAVPFGDDVVLVYATIDAVERIVGRPTNDGFEFSKPEVVHRPRSPARDLRLAATPDRLHLVWTESAGAGADQTLHYASSTGPDVPWSPPVTLSATVRPSSANLLSNDGEVFVAWIDMRLDAAPYRDADTGRIMAAVSDDGGEGFSRPFVISDLNDPNDTAGQLLVTMSMQDVVVYWSRDPDLAWPDRWSKAILDPGRRVIKPVGEVGGKELLAACRKRVTSYLGDRSGGRGGPDAARTASVGTGEQRGSATPR
jgi:hypothetical protein